GTWKTSYHLGGLHDHAEGEDYPACHTSCTSKQCFHAGLRGGMIAWACSLHCRRWA
ncbi:hypothetical protein K443DRAFT_105251, partial [Laccaria amethystina LaAM-08-1]